MTQIAEARAAVMEYLQGCAADMPEGDTFLLLDEKTIEHAWGWVFFYTSSLWQRTGELQYALAGNAPLIVERKTRRILPTGTAQPLEHYIANYERTGNPGE